MILHGTATWPGVNPGACVMCTYTCSHGASPSVATFVMPAQPANPPAGAGQLRIEDGTGRVVRLDGCKIDRFDVSNNGSQWQLYILDRRWKWAFGAVSGTYNARDDRNELDVKYIRSAYDLGVILLVAMGETDFSAEGLPTNQYPPVEWIAENPASALESLAGQYGCRVVYRPSSNTVLVAQQGVGLGLPTDIPISSSSPAINFPEAPDSIVLIGAPIEYEMMLALEAVMMDIDGEIKPIDDILYKPTAGWTKTIPGNDARLTQVKINPIYEERTQDELDSAVKGLFQETYLKWYRVKMTNVDGTGKPLEIPGYGVVSDRHRLLISDKRVSVATSVDGTLVQKPAEIRGRFHRARQLKVAAADVFFNSTMSEKIDESFTVEPASGLVKFANPVFALITSNTHPAQLVLRCAVTVRNPTSNEINRYLRVLTANPNPTTGPEVIRRPEVALKVVGQYKLANLGAAENAAPRWALTGVETNGQACDAVAALFLAQAAARYTTEGSATIEYPGIIPLAPDGAIQQITWQIGGGMPPKTIATRNSEHAYWLPPFEELRRLRFIREVAKPTEGKAPTAPAPPLGPEGSMYDKFGQKNPGYRP